VRAKKIYIALTLDIEPPWACYATPTTALRLYRARSRDYSQVWAQNPTWLLLANGNGIEPLSDDVRYVLHN